MKKYRPGRIIVFLALLVFPCCFFAQSANGPKSLGAGLDDLAEQISRDLSENQKRKIAVIEFVDLKGNVTDLGRYVSEKLITRLFQTKKFTVVERQQLNKLIAEQKLSLTGIIEPSAAQKLGKLAGVDAIAAGSVTDLTKTIEINARLISTETGEVFSAASVEILKDDTVCNLMGGCSSEGSKGLQPSDKTGIPANKTWKVEGNFFTFEVTKCVRSGAAAFCDFMITSNERDTNMTLYGFFRDNPVERYFSRAFDDMGGEYSGKGVQAGSEGKQGILYLSLVKGITIKARIYFEGIDQTASKFNLLEIGWRSGEKMYSSQFRDIPLSK